MVSYVEVTAKKERLQLIIGILRILVMIIVLLGVRAFFSNRLYLSFKIALLLISLIGITIKFEYDLVEINKLLQPYSFNNNV